MISSGATMRVGSTLLFASALMGIGCASSSATAPATPTATATATATATPTPTATATATTTATAPATPTATATTPADLAPFPYTPDQIRDSCVPGHTLVFRMEVPGKPTVITTFHFVAQTSDTADLEESTTDEAGKPLGPPERSTAKWSDLQKHASFPGAATTITTERITTPAGTFATHVYKVKRKGDEVSTFYFADEMPGPPVLFFTDRGGTRVMTSTLVKVVAGSR